MNDPLLLSPSRPSARAVPASPRMTTRYVIYGLSARDIYHFILPLAGKGCSLRLADRPVFASASTPRANTHDRQREWNVPIICGGIIVGPSDHIGADEDGIVGLSWPGRNEALAAARGVHAKEQFLEEHLDAGCSLPQTVAK